MILHLHSLVELNEINGLDSYENMPTDGGYKLTFEEIIQCDHFSKISREDAEMLIEMLWLYSVIAYNSYKNN